jgi:hypothetical protein
MSPWTILGYGLVASLLLVLAIGKRTSRQVVVVHPVPACPRCHTDDPWVDDDGVALCPCCCCSYEVVTL